MLCRAIFDSIAIKNKLGFFYQIFIIIKDNNILIKIYTVSLKRVRMEQIFGVCTSNLKAFKT